MNIELSEVVALPSIVGVQIGLIPGQPERTGEGRIGRPVRQQVAALHGEHVEMQVWLQAIDSLGRDDPAGPARETVTLAVGGFAGLAAKQFRNFVFPAPS